MIARRALLSHGMLAVANYAATGALLTCAGLYFINVRTLVRELWSKYLATRVMCGCLLLGFDRVAEWKQLCDDWLYLSVIDHKGDLSEVISIRVNGDSRAAYAALVQ
jgi:hypothetical protein